MKKTLLLLCLIIGILGGYLYNRQSFEPIEAAHLSQLCQITAQPLWSTFSKKEAQQTLVDMVKRDVHPQLAKILNKHFEKSKTFDDFKSQFQTPELKSFDCPRLSNFFGE